MSAYTTSYAIRYSTPIVQQKIEVAVVTAATNIKNEDPATADHTNRLNWAHWVHRSSSVAWVPFAWAVAQNPTIGGSVASDPSGQSVADSDVLFVVDSLVETVITDWVAHPPGII